MQVATQKKCELETDTKLKAVSDRGSNKSQSKR